MKKKLNNNNYINLCLILLGVMFITIASSNLYKNHYDNKINKSYISKYVSNMAPNEVEDVLIEVNPDAFIYVSYTGNSEIYNLEVKLRRQLKDYELVDNFIYMDTTEMMKEKEYLNTLNESLGIKDSGLTKLPGIIYYKDNEIVDFIDSKNGIINTGDFAQLLEKYELINK